MKFVEFIEWVNTAKIKQLDRDAILAVDFNNPVNYVEEVRALILDSINRMSKNLAQKRYYRDEIATLNKIYTDLIGSEFYDSMFDVFVSKRIEERKKVTLSQVEDTLSDPVKLNTAIKKREVITLPAGSVYELNGDYLGYLCSSHFDPLNNVALFKNGTRIVAYVSQAFNAADVQALGYDATMFDPANIVRLREAIIVEAACCDAESQHSEQDQNIIQSLNRTNIEDVTGITRKFITSWSLINEGHLLDGQLPRLAALGRRTTLLHYDIDDTAQVANQSPKYVEFVQAYRELELLPTVTENEKTMKDQALATLKETIAEMKMKRVDPAEFEEVCELLTSKCRRYIKDIPEQKVKDTKDAIDRVMRSLSEIRSIANRHSDKSDYKGEYFTKDEEDKRAAIVHSYFALGSIIGALMQSAGTDDLLPVIVNDVSTFIRKYPQLFSDKDLLPLVSGRYFESDLFSKIRKDIDYSKNDLSALDQEKADEMNRITADNMVSYSFVLFNSAMQVARVAWLLESQGNINANDIVISDAKAIYYYLVGIFDERIKSKEGAGEPYENLAKELSEFRKEAKALDNGPDAENKHAWLKLGMKIRDSLQIFPAHVIADRDKEELDEAPLMQSPVQGRAGDRSSKTAEELGALHWPDDDSREAGEESPLIEIEEDASIEHAGNTGANVSSVEPVVGTAVSQPGMVDVSDDPKITTLKTACDEYMRHLGRDIHDSVYDADFDLWKSLRSEPTPESPPRFYIRDITNPSDENAKRVEQLRKDNPKLDVAIKKYMAVREMKGKLLDNKPASERLADFKAAFADNKNLIEQRRESSGVKFLRIVSKIFFGIGFIPGLWGVTGRKFSGKVERELPPEPKQGPKKT